MTYFAYGEGQPRLSDDRLPVLLLTLDGLGDRPVSELGDGPPGPGRGQTPSEAALTPVLDRLTARGACGWHVPFGWGLAPASELAHWAMFGYADVPFPGRAVLEALGAGLSVPGGRAVTYAALRASRAEPACGGDSRVWITGRARGGDPRDEQDASRLWDELLPMLRRAGVETHGLGRGEAVLVFDGHPHAQVTDSDPFFEDFHPWLRVRPSGPASVPLASTLNQLLVGMRATLLSSQVNAARRAAGRPALDVVTTKWTGVRQPLASFTEQAGVPGAMVTSSRLYRGVAELLGMEAVHVSPPKELLQRAGTDLAERIGVAADLLEGGARFVHVHTKATDEAGHTKMPRAKLEVLEQIDPVMTALESLAESAVVAVTGDHATPSVDGVLHTADPTPLLLAGPTVRPDRVTRFGEAYFQDGWFGRVRAEELLPLLFSHANRPVFMGHRASPSRTWALPDAPDPMTVPAALTLEEPAGPRGPRGPSSRGAPRSS